jgi:hypothetical protein
LRDDFGRLPPLSLLQRLDLAHPPTLRGVRVVRSVLCLDL